jgi:5-methylcytosine-specific restriction endonuclease McrBC regulatory subunit McrC
MVGLLESEISTNTLYQIAEKAKLSFKENCDRAIIIDLLIKKITEVEAKSTEDLLKMNYDQIMAYFESYSIGNNDLMKIMNELNYKVGSEDKKHLRSFVARQISETALFSSVASHGGNG